MTFTENILPGLFGCAATYWLFLALRNLPTLPSIEPDRVYVPEEKESRLELPRIPLLKPDLSRILEKAHKEGLTPEDMDAAIRTVLARKRIETAPEVVRPDLEIIENE